MAEVIWRQKAVASRIEILKYGKSKFGETVARRLNEKIEECSARLKIHPYIGFIEPALVGRPVIYRSVMINKRFKLIYSFSIRETRLIFAGKIRDNVRGFRIYGGGGADRLAAAPSQGGVDRQGHDGTYLAAAVDSGC